LCYFDHKSLTTTTKIAIVLVGVFSVLNSTFSKTSGERHSPVLFKHLLFLLPHVTINTLKIEAAVSCDTLGAI
jgi:hypothetical protein